MRFLLSVYHDVLSVDAVKTRNSTSHAARRDSDGRAKTRVESPRRKLARPRWADREISDSGMRQLQGAAASHFDPLLNSAQRAWHKVTCDLQAPAASRSDRVVMADRSRLLQSRYGDQSSHTRVAGPETIAAAKKKRAEQRRAAVLALQHDEEEFIPLDATHASRSVAHTSSALDTYAGPHPESGLQREEDDLGSGEDEHAEFTLSLIHI